MSGINRAGSGRNDRPLQRLTGQTPSTTAQQMRTCPACNKEFGLDEYLDHVYDNDDCYRAYLASEKKEMSKQ